MGVVVAIAGVSQAAPDMWNYDFEHFADGTDWGHDPQVTTVEGWTVGGSSTASYTRGVIETYGTTKAIGTNWYEYSDAQVGFAVGGSGNIATIANMATAPAIVYSYDSEPSAPGAYDVHHWLGIYEGGTRRLMVGQDWTDTGFWTFSFPNGSLQSATPYVVGVYIEVDIEVDLVTGLGTVKFDGVADPNLTNIDLIGASAVDLRLATDIHHYIRGGKLVDLTVVAIPEPATMGVLALGGMALLFRRRRR
jgi:hypothetical protein